MKGRSRRARDPLTFELVRSGLESVADEMARTLARAAYSPILRNSNDYSTALLTKDAEVMAQGRTSPVLLGAVMAACKSVSEKYRDRMEPEDVFIVNDPYEGGSHLPDLFVIKPVFVQGKVAAFVGSEAHHSDMGGWIPGSNAADSREIFAEGLRIPPTHLVRAGTPNETLFDLLDRNCRFPDRVRGDLGGQMAALRVGEEGLNALWRRYGVDVLDEYVAELLNYGEQLARHEIGKWPDGTYTFVDWIDDDGVGPEPVPISVQIDIVGDRLHIDFAGSADQVMSAINSPASFTESAALVAVRCAMGVEIPHNSGYTRAIRISVPEGTILNPRSPAAVSARTLTGFRVFDTMSGCLAKIVPQRVMAANQGANTLITFAGSDAAGHDFILTDILFGSWGARQRSHGIDGLCPPLVHISNTPAETIERETPLMVTQYEFVPDTCGAGEFRGGLAVARGYRVASGRTLVQVRTDRGRVPPYGLFGGRPGALARNVVEQDGKMKDWHPRETGWLDEGDAITVILAGAGGWGDPLEADPDAIASAARDEKITAQYARDAFGVVFEKTGGVDAHRTVERRNELRSSRSRAPGLAATAGASANATGVPYEQRPAPARS